MTTPPWGAGKVVLSNTRTTHATTFGPASLEVTLPDQEPMTVRTDDDGSTTVELSDAARAGASRVVVKMAGRPLPVEWE